MTCHHPDLASASDWSLRMGILLQPIRSTTQIWVVKRHQYRISSLVSHTSSRVGISGGVVKRLLFSIYNKQAGEFYCAAFVFFLRVNVSAAASVTRLDRRKSLFGTYETSSSLTADRRFPSKREMRTIKLWKKCSMLYSNCLFDGSLRSKRFR